jgi:hypothetical protein
MSEAWTNYVALGLNLARILFRHLSLINKHEWISADIEPLQVPPLRRVLERVR